MTNNNSTTIVHQNPHRSVQTNSSITTAASKCGIAVVPKRSITATAETISINENGKINSVVSINKINNVFDSEGNIHLASGEEDISDESEILLNYSVVQSMTESNGTTYL